jgi:hypothetical protein
MIHTVSYPRLGATDTTTQIVGGGAQLASATLATVQAASTAGLITLSSTLAAAVPIAGAVIAVGVIAYSLLHNSRGLQQNVETTNAVNQGEQVMKANLAAWNTSAKSYATQAQALQNFDDAWNAIVNFCSRASEGSPGQRCISERQRGGIYDYPKAYRDPISSDPSAGLVDKAAAAASSANIDLGFGGSSLPLPLLIGAGLITAAWFLK